MREMYGPTGSLLGSDLYMPAYDRAAAQIYAAPAAAFPYPAQAPTMPVTATA